MRVPSGRGRRNRFLLSLKLPWSSRTFEDEADSVFFSPCYESTRTLGVNDSPSDILSQYIFFCSAVLRSIFLNSVLTQWIIKNSLYTKNTIFKLCPLLQKLSSRFVRYRLMDFKKTFSVTRLLHEIRSIHLAASVIRLSDSFITVQRLAPF